jgi:hypothetical protein
MRTVSARERIGYCRQNAKSCPRKCRPSINFYCLKSTRSISSNGIYAEDKAKNAAARDRPKIDRVPKLTASTASRSAYGQFGYVSSRYWSNRLSRSVYFTLLQLFGPHHVLCSRDCYRAVAQRLFLGVLPKPVHATRPDAEASPVMHFTRIPREELPQEIPPDPVLVRPAPAFADLHDAHSHPGFTRR